MPDIKQKGNQTVTKIVVYGAMILFALGMLIWTAYVKKRCVFVIAVKVGTTSGGKNAATSDYQYSYKKIIYTFSKRDYGSGDSLIFLKVLPDNPERSVYISEEVRPCIISKNIENTSWKELPTCE